MSKIIVQALPTEAEMVELLQSLIDSRSEFTNALDLDVSHIDWRAQVHVVQITQVGINGPYIEVSYKLEYSIYNGCKDMNVVDVEDLHVTGELTADGWAFDEHIPPPRRNTVEEF